MNFTNPSDLDHPVLKLREIRNVPEILNATFEMIREDFPKLRRSFLLYVFPILLIGQLLMEFFFIGTVTEFWLKMVGYSGMDIQAISTGNSNLDLLLGLLGAAGSIAGSSLLIAMAFGYLKLRDRYGPNEFDAHDIWYETQSLFGKVLGTNVGLGLVAGGLLFGILFITGIIVNIIPDPLFVGLVFFGAIVIVIPSLITTYALYYPARFLGGERFTDAFTRASRLIQGRWWQTLGLLFSSFLILYALYGIIEVPGLLQQMGMVPTFEKSSLVWWFLTLLIVLLTAMLQGLFIIQMVALSLHYYSQAERRHWVSLVEEVEMIGKEPLLHDEDETMAEG